MFGRLTNSFRINPQINPHCTAQSSTSYKCSTALKLYKPNSDSYISLLVEIERYIRGKRWSINIPQRSIHKVRVSKDNLLITFENTTFAINKNLVPNDCIDVTTENQTISFNIIIGHNETIKEVILLKNDEKKHFSLTLTRNLGATDTEVNFIEYNYTLAWPNDNVYEGDLVNGKMTGKGKFTWPNNNVYEGDFVDGKRTTGKGKFTWPNGDAYEGDLVDDKMTGKGKLTWPNGNVYEGDFVDDKRTGKGKFTWPDGKIYEGDFVDDKRTGKGKLTWPDGKVYEGDFVDDKRTGKGKFIWPNGVYEGDFVNGKMTGKGKYTCLNGNIYEGELNKNVLSNGRLRNTQRSGFIKLRNYNFDTNNENYDICNINYKFVHLLSFESLELRGAVVYAEENDEEDANWLPT